MALIKLRKANEAGEDVGVVFVNTDQIVAINAGQNATELQMTDGRTRWNPRGSCFVGEDDLMRASRGER